METRKLSVIIIFLAVTGAVLLLYGFLSEKSDIISKTDNLFCPDCNVIMISLSNVSAEHMNLYGYDRLTTPYLDKWSKDAFVFENAFTQTSWTLPVATSLFTSLYPYTHKIMNRFNNNILDSKIKTLPEILRDSGYRTVAFTGGLDYSKNLGHMRGFDTVDDGDENVSSLDAIYFSGFVSTLNKAEKWLKENQSSKFFLFLHGYDAHCPFDPPKKFAGIFSSEKNKNVTVNNQLCLRGYKKSDDGVYEAYYYRDGQQKISLTQDDIDYLRDKYDEEILSVDELVGGFLNNLEEQISNNTVVILFSDHGEMFAKNGRFGRAGAVRGTLYDEVLRVPLIIKIPSATGGRVGGLVEVVDIMPTVLSILGKPSPDSSQGKNLTPLMLGVVDKIKNYVFSGSRFDWSQNKAGFGIYEISGAVDSWAESIRSQNWKLIHEIRFGPQKKLLEDTYELYNLEQDPDELNNVVNEEALKAEELKNKLEAWANDAVNYNFKNKSAPSVLSPGVVEEAKKRGYW